MPTVIRSRRLPLALLTLVLLASACTPSVPPTALPPTDTMAPTPEASDAYPDPSSHSLRSRPYAGPQPAPSRVVRTAAADAQVSRSDVHRIG